MTLDHRSRAAVDRHRFDDVGIERALSKEPYVPAPVLLQLQGFVLEHIDEKLADDLPFVLGIADPREGSQEAL